MLDLLAMLPSSTYNPRIADSARSNNSRNSLSATGRLTYNAGITLLC